MRRARRDHLRRDNGLRKTTAKQGAKRIPAHPKAALAGCFAKTSFAYHGTPAQPQFTQWGDPRRGGIPGARRPPRFSCTPCAWGSCDEYKRSNITVYRRGRSALGGSTPASLEPSFAAFFIIPCHSFEGKNFKEVTLRYASRESDQIGTGQCQRSCGHPEYPNCRGFVLRAFGKLREASWRSLPFQSGANPCANLLLPQRWATG